MHDHRNQACTYMANGSVKCVKAPQKTKETFVTNDEGVKIYKINENAPMVVKKTRTFTLNELVGVSRIVIPATSTVRICFNMGLKLSQMLNTQMNDTYIELLKLFFGLNIGQGTFSIMARTPNVCINVYTTSNSYDISIPRTLNDFFKRLVDQLSYCTSKYTSIEPLINVKFSDDPGFGTELTRDIADKTTALLAKVSEWYQRDQAKINREISESKCFGKPNMDQVISSIFSMNCPSYTKVVVPTEKVNTYQMTSVPVQPETKSVRVIRE